jgi:signal transduction histidine kinase
MSESQVASQAGAAAAAAKPDYDIAQVVRHLVHEIRQPLSTIESIAFYLEMVLPRAEGKARRQLSKLQQEVEQINWVLCDAIHFLQASPPRLQAMDLSEVVSKSFGEWRTLPGVRVCQQLAAQLPPVALDLEQIQHLLRNVTSFFARIAAGEAAVLVETRSAEGGVVLEISANAPQWPTEEAAALFEPFEPSAPAGAGLKLASARRIAEAHGARIEVHSGPDARVSLTLLFPPA